MYQLTIRTDGKWWIEGYYTTVEAADGQHEQLHEQGKLVTPWVIVKIENATVEPKND